VRLKNMLMKSSKLLITLVQKVPKNLLLNIERKIRVPKRRIEFDDEQYEELENLYFELDKALLSAEDFEYLTNDEAIDLLADARDYLQGLMEEVEDVEEN